jgi:hypothetical protein
MLGDLAGLQQSAIAALAIRFQPKWPEAICRIMYLRYLLLSKRTGTPPSPEHMRTGMPHSSFR